MKSQAANSKRLSPALSFGHWILEIGISFVIRISSFVIFCLSGLAYGAGSSDSGFPEVQSLQIGFANHYRLGCWTPVNLTLSGALGDSGASGQLELQAPMAMGYPFGSSVRD